MNRRATTVSIWPGDFAAVRGITREGLIAFGQSCNRWRALRSVICVATELSSTARARHRLNSKGTQPARKIRP
jgi:hypothetical protein